MRNDGLDGIVPPDVTPNRNIAHALANDRGLLLGLAGGLLLLVALMVLTLVISVTDKPWQPLGPFPVQEVAEINEDFVHVIGTKCYEEDVAVFGTFGWQRVDPPGFAITLGEGIADREEGCLTQEFDNNIPAGVLEADVPGAIWRIVGREVPVREDGTEGTPLAWQTEDFELP